MVSVKCLTYSTDKVSVCVDVKLPDGPNVIRLSRSPEEVIIFAECTIELITVHFRLSLSKSKGKAIPVQAWTGPEGSRRLRLPHFKTIGTRRR